ncbi:hypothetical protein ACO0M4_30590 [Streptomyces sp. RGM 3693]|uniref:hypothetical protein n=1 Tax=Streptomyces sp. RGM 3693 TaxID=3413284 RepID=UPI003D2770DB
MRKLQKAAVVTLVIGSFGFLGAGSAYANGGREGGMGTDFDIKQGSQCRSHDLNVDVLGEVGILNGVLGNALGGEGSPGAQSTRMGSSMGCDNSFTFKGDEGGRGGKGGGEDEGGRGGKGGGSEAREGNDGKEAGEGRNGKEGKDGGEAREGGEGPARAVGGDGGE